ncbi:MAG: hypothetical protein KTM48_00295, partial [Wolbachia endosymbiont of Pissodes strobi]|nr:hypothetical protein [Wolbachia endosymbiont of Pissodes strobi]
IGSTFSVCATAIKKKKKKKKKNILKRSNKPLKIQIDSNHYGKIAHYYYSGLPIEYYKSYNMPREEINMRISKQISGPKK